jgi:hypothetical protein
MHKWQNKLNSKNKPNRTTTALLNNRTDSTIEMIITNALAQRTVVTVTKTNIHETTAADRPHEIVPTPTRSVRDAQAITTETAHHSTMTKGNISILAPDFTQHHRKVEKSRKHIKRKDKKNKTIKRNRPLQGSTMKLGSGIIKSTVQQLSDENFHFYNSLVLTDDLTFQRTYFRTTPPNIPRIYNHDASTDDKDDLPLQHRSQLQNHELMKIAILIATNTCTKETSHAIIDSGASCCLIPYIEDFIHQPTPIQNTTLKGIAGGLTALVRGTLQLKIHQNDTDNIILVKDNVIYAPDCHIRLIIPQQLHRQSKAKGHENSCFTTEETTATLYHGGDTFTCAYHPKTKIPTLNCITDNKTQKTQIAAPSTFTHQPSNKGRKRAIFHNDKPPCPTAA